MTGATSESSSLLVASAAVSRMGYALSTDNFLKGWNNSYRPVSEYEFMSFLFLDK